MQRLKIVKIPFIGFSFFFLSFFPFFCIFYCEALEDIAVWWSTARMLGTRTIHKLMGGLYRNVLLGSKYLLGTYRTGKVFIHIHN